MNPKRIFENLSQVKGPASNLTNYIECYIFRKINAGEGYHVYKFMPCRHSNSIDFFLGDSYDTIDLHTGALIPFKRCTIRGPRTYKKYRIRIHGNFKSFSIRFKPSGLYRLFKIPMENFCNEAVDATLIRKEFFSELTERLIDCNDIQSCIDIAEPFFTDLITERNQKDSIPSLLAKQLLARDISFPVQELYKQFPITTRQLERNFIREIGVGPKTYSCLIRFENLIYHRIEKPNMKWSEMAYEHHYFDQMHMIKDFHKYLGINPGDFSPSDFAI